MSTTDLTVIAGDERLHIFRLEAPGKYRHYSRPRWEKNNDGREEDKHEWTKDEAVMWMSANQAGGADPITDAELKWVHNGVEKGFGGQAAEEPKADPDRQKPGPTFQCLDCKKVFPATDRRKFSFSTFSDDIGYCPECFKKRSGGFSGPRFPGVM
jgi:hypothetical protein